MEVKLSIQEVEVLVVGAGQAGIAMSEHLGAHGVPWPRVARPLPGPGV
jgi:putative flavoprotein involved in K+ transport